MRESGAVTSVTGEGSIEVGPTVGTCIVSLNTGEYMNTVSNLLTLKTTSAGSKVF